MLDDWVRLPGGRVQRLIEFRLLRGVLDFALLWGLLRLFEGRSLSASGLFARQGWRSRFGFGLALGAVPLLLQAGSLALAGFYRFSAPGSASVLEVVGLGLVLLVAALDEEIRFRALLLRPIDEGLGSVAAMVLSGLVFGLSHLGNRGASVAGVAVITAGGVLLAAAYLRFRSLWITTGFHWSWNLTMGAVLGLPVSGVRLPSLLTAEVSGPELWTGGDFGPEASALTAGLVVVVTVLAVRSAARAGALYTPPWLRRAVDRARGRAPQA